MLEILSEASGVIVAASILFAARELRRISDALRDLDVRVGRLELKPMHLTRLLIRMKASFGRSLERLSRLLAAWAHRLF